MMKRLALALLFSLWSASAFATFTITAAPTASGSGAAVVAGPSTISITLNGSIPAGAYVYVAVQDATTSASLGTVADSSGGGNTYNSVASVLLNNSSVRGKLIVFVAANISALSSGNTITYTGPGGSAVLLISVLYVTGANAIDSAVTATAFGTSSSASVSTSVTAAGTPTATDQYIAAVAVSGQNTVTALSFTQDSTHAAYAAPPTPIQNSSGQRSFYGGSVVSASQLTYAPSYIVTPAANSYWGSIIIALKPAGAVAAKPFIFIPATIP